MPTLIPSDTRRRHRSRQATARRVYLVRTQPELFTPLVRDSIENARMRAVDALGDVYDWDCHLCRHSVITLTLSDPCPRCKGYGSAPVTPLQRTFIATAVEAG